MWPEPSGARIQSQGRLNSVVTSCYLPCLLRNLHHALLNRGRCCSGREFSENQQEQVQLSACVYTGGTHLENGGTAKDPGGIFRLLVLKCSK